MLFTAAGSYELAAGSSMTGITRLGAGTNPPLAKAGLLCEGFLFLYGLYASATTLLSCSGVRRRHGFCSLLLCMLCRVPDLASLVRPISVVLVCTTALALQLFIRGPMGTTHKPLSKAFQGLMKRHQRLTGVCGAQPCGGVSHASIVSLSMPG